MDMLNRGTKIILVALFVMCYHILPAQSVRVKASANKDHILVGEPILLQLEAECPADETIGWFKLDSIPHFEFIDTGKIDTLPGTIGRLFRQAISITSFDSGSQVIPQMAITLKNGRFVTDSIKIEVGYSGADPSQPYHDIREIIEVPAVEPLYVNYIIAVITIVAIVTLVLLLRGKTNVIVTDSVKKVPGLSAFENAMAALSALKSGIGSGSVQFKIYYIQLNTILRDYCREEHLGALPDNDNSRLVIDLKGKLLNEELVQLAQVLRQADAVKFAKYQPTEEEDEQAYDVIRNSIGKINQEAHKKLSV